MVATFATLLLAAAAAHPGKGPAGALLALSRPSQTRAVASAVEPPTPLRWLRAPSAVLSEGEARPVRRATTTALPLDLESFSGAVCLKGAWTLRAARILDEENEAGHPRWQMEISPAVVADGARFLPGIGAITRF